jgi:uncharacterized protein YjgD (DUF1641 family)
MKWYPYCKNKETFMKEINQYAVQDNYQGLIDLINKEEYSSATLILSELYKNDKTLAPLLDKIKNRIDSKNYLPFLNHFVKHVPDQSKLFKDPNNMFFYLIMSGVEKATIEDILKYTDLGLTKDEMQTNKDYIQFYSILRKLSVNIDSINANDLKFLKQKYEMLYGVILHLGNNTFPLGEVKNKILDILDTYYYGKRGEAITLREQGQQAIMDRYDTLFSLFKKTNEVYKLKMIRESALNILNAEFTKAPNQKETLKSGAIKREVFNDPYYKGGWGRFNLFKIVRNKMIRRFGGETGTVSKIKKM